MDHSQDAWGTPTNRSNPAPASQLGLIPIKNSTTQSSAHEATIAKLLKEVASLKASQSKSDRKKANTSNPKVVVSNVAPASRPAPKKAPVPTTRSSNRAPPSVPASKKKASVQTQPKRSQRATSAPPEFTNKKKNA
ncbi:hypothetical protein MJO29_008561 [Puccinia striiformis f. sp. tritici]|uniref:Uncharacterized protein n=1 Tax=Puccinia striiformis f. sp. tritici PST-78 TaxID=1165861 RepID=A0A0L0W2W9_9BASI|nr:hypothetical protein MJO29_008561 [Puccinia striiformis f. sp. tritici]KAI9603012.1 hypothetical protein H4Q26_002322 [Puccinia striiformis f. sp. tritici PST-130]KNF05812.1 hypothetical protein PSTG_01209 [Puccinia striiformis f. sp. tritici PST-78]